jgi:hypothetical protein
LQVTVYGLLGKATKVDLLRACTRVGGNLLIRFHAFRYRAPSWCRNADRRQTREQTPFKPLITALQHRY